MSFSVYGNAPFISGKVPDARTDRVKSLVSENDPFPISLYGTVRHTDSDGSD